MFAPTIVATRFGELLFFLYGFEKSDRNTLSGRELRIWQDVARELLGLADEDLTMALAHKSLLEIDHEQND